VEKIWSSLTTNEDAVNIVNRQNKLTTFDNNHKDTV